MNPSPSTRPSDRRMLALATSLVLVATLVLAPSSAWFASAASDVTVVNWQLKGNKGTSPTTNFLGTTDSEPLVLRTNNIEAMRVLAGIGNAAGNVGIGTTTPAFPLDVRGEVNSSAGYAIGGTTALRTNQISTYVGQGAGAFSVAAGDTAVGASALANDSSGVGNTAVGSLALQGSATDSDNTATGYYALQHNIGGNNNTADGTAALQSNTTGNSNVAIGQLALYDNTTGSNNIAIGNNAGVSEMSANANTTGLNNTFIGATAGPGTPTQLTDATAVGENALVSANNALVLGGTGPDAVNVGIGTQTPQSTLQVAANGSSSATNYGNYLQIPIVSSASGPPATDCNNSTLAGRMVLQDTAGAITLWVCSAASGAWIAK